MANHIPTHTSSHADIFKKIKRMEEKRIFGNEEKEFPPKIKYEKRVPLPPEEKPDHPRIYPTCFPKNPNVIHKEQYLTRRNCAITTGPSSNYYLIEKI
jgi:hypothetical protein